VALVAKSADVVPLQLAVRGGPVLASDLGTPRPYDRLMAADTLRSSQIAESAYADVWAAVQEWPGFGAFDAAMRAFPETEVFLAGGVLRDYFRTGKCTPKDFDFFLGGLGVDNFIKHLAVHGELSKGPFGSPRWRPTDASARYADLIPIDRFNNGIWRCEDIVDALNQFDFTANAIALDMRRPRLFDPQNGVRDARATKMRAVRFDYPEEPISPELPLTRHGVLWIRLLHYAGTLGLSIEPLTEKWLYDHAQLRMQADDFAQAFFTPNLQLRPRHTP
jgi:tRNA nucleotidyltransferase (CCA-adding enzyme)